VTALTYFAGIAGPVVRPMTSPPAGGGGGGDPGAGITQVLARTRNVPDGGGLNITGALIPATGDLLMFRSTGAERLWVTASGPGVTVTVDVGARILGQPVDPFPAVELAQGALYQFGPFHSVLNAAGTASVQVTLSSVTGVQVAVIQEPAAT
jgi:hypothetical protein